MPNFASKQPFSGMVQLDKLRAGLGGRYGSAEREE
jgi:hypothetical protein